MKFLTNEKNYKIILIVFSCVFLFLTLILFQFTVDDSFITYRYAKNLVTHGIWNWNPSGSTVEEAYTNFLYAILAILPEFLKINTLIFFKLLGAVSILYLAVRLSHLIKNKIIYFASLTFLILNPFFYLHAYSGLETPIFIVLIFELIVFLTLKERVQNEKLFYLVFLLLPLTRPEGALYSLIGFFLFWYKNKSIQSKKYFILILLIGIGYFISRYKYFGELLPNTFYVKSAGGFNLNRFVNYIFGNIKYWGVILLFVVVKDRSYRILLATSIIINILLYASSDLQMNFADRFPFQTFAPFYIAAFVYIDDKYSFYIVSVITAFLMGFIFDGNSIINNALYYPKLREAYGGLGVSLSKYKNEKLSLMSGDVGLISYFSEWYVYDLIGLANKHIAKNGISFDYLQATKPDLILLYSRSEGEKRIGFEELTYMNLMDNYILQSKSYNYVGAIKVTDNFFLLAFLKSDVKRFDEIKSSIKSVENKTLNFKINKREYILQHYLTYPGT
jgi:hypothetical protein